MKTTFVRSAYQLADIFTKAIREVRFKDLICKLGILNIHSLEGVWRNIKGITVITLLGC